jgi:hypothetical protein
LKLPRNLEAPIRRPLRANSIRKAKGEKVHHGRKPAVIDRIVKVVKVPQWRVLADGTFAEPFSGYPAPRHVICCQLAREV